MLLYYFKGMRRVIINITFFISICIIVFSCAKMGTLSGGAKDTEPPTITKTKPENGSVNFNESSFSIYFNEYVRLNKINEKLLISPPIEEQPEVILKGKRIEVKIKPEYLLPNTTYNFNFSDAIADNNENNPISGFVYAFSTGSTIDSLSIKGKVIDAFKLTPVEGVYVSIYKSNNDSLFLTQRPDYIGRTNKEGDFIIPYIADNAYNIYAIKDENYNYIFDQKTEAIAFIDYRIRPKITFDTIVDLDSNINIKQRFIPDSLELLLFTEDHLSQYITKTERKTPHFCQVIFSRPHVSKPIIIIENLVDNYIKFSEGLDTVNIWFTKNNLYLKDSIEMIFRYVEPLYPDSVRTDTVFAIIDQQSKIKPGLELTKPKNKEIFKPYTLTLNNPVLNIDNKLIKIIYTEDTTEIELANNTYISKDSLRVFIEADFILGEKYDIKLEEGFITDVFGFKNKPDSVYAYIKNEDDYGHLKINIPDFENKNAYVELLQKENVVYIEQLINGYADFTYINPDIYKIRFVRDLNNNMQWDPGKFSSKLQSEPVYYHPDEIEIRNNWQHEITWMIE
jgi:hypothetical protein